MSGEHKYSINPSTTFLYYLLYDVEDPDNEGGDNNPDGCNTPSGGNTNQSSGTNTSHQYSLNISSADISKGTVDTSVNKSNSKGSRVNIQATLASGYIFEKWSTPQLLAP